jgi:hypothetical protein
MRMERRREVHVTPKVGLLLLLVLSVLVAGAAAQERHLERGSAAVLYTQSAFAHGYIHGYELGFHCGDVDLQFGRDARDPTSLAPYKRPWVAYKVGFGSKDHFKAGFQDGFRVGYSEATRGLTFRAIASLGQAAVGLTNKPEFATAFDKGFYDGYQSGRQQGSDDGREHSAFNPINPPCLGLPAAYCDAFGRAFEVGYGDGYRNQRIETVASDKLQASAKK